MKKLLFALPFLFLALPASASTWGADNCGFGLFGDLPCSAPTVGDKNDKPDRPKADKPERESRHGHRHHRHGHRGRRGHRGHRGHHNSDD